MSLSFVYLGTYRVLKPKAFRNRHPRVEATPIFPQITHPKNQDQKISIITYIHYSFAIALLMPISNLIDNINWYPINIITGKISSEWQK